MPGPEDQTAMDTLIAIARALLLLLLMIAPTLTLLLLLSFDIKPKIYAIIKFFLCILFPLIVVLLGVVVDVTTLGFDILNLSTSWYFIVPFVWFGLGIIFYVATE
jgi:hypothetical protein